MSERIKYKNPTMQFHIEDDPKSLLKEQKKSLEELEPVKLNSVQYLWCN